MKQKTSPLGRKIKQARQTLSETRGIKMTQAEFATLIGISRTYLCDIETGRTAPSLEVVSKVAELCGYTLDAFSTETNRSLSESSVSNIPILGIVRAGIPIDAVEDVRGFVSVPLRGANSDYFGLYIVGDSMNLSGIKEGDVVIVRKQESVENGQIAVVIVDSDLATVKRVHVSDNIVTLMPNSSNPKNLPIMVDTNRTRVQILGLVVKAVINV